MYGKLHKFLSLSLKTFRTQKRRFFFDLTAILRLSKDRNRMLTLNRSSTSSTSMLVDWSYIVLPLNGKSRTRLFVTAASGCDHMWTCDSRSSVEWFQRSCDHLRSSAIVCEPVYNILYQKHMKYIGIFRWHIIDSLGINDTITRFLTRCFWVQAVPAVKINYC